jgi:proteasome assembly chaperone (PAC2) family protein
VEFLKFSNLPDLRSPVVVAAFAGWNDAGEAATMALNTLETQWNAQEFASIDPDEFYDFTQVRPRVSLDMQMVRVIEWPANTFRFHRAPAQQHDIVLLRGVEPHLRWRRYVGGIMELFERLDVSLLVTLGALLADVPHTQPVQLTGFATDEHLLSRLRAIGVELSRYEGPTGIVGVLHDAAQQRGLPAMSLWAAAPHYIAVAANPTVALALLEGLAQVLDWSFDLSALRQASHQFNQQINAIIAANPEAAAYVARLEQATGEVNQSPLPSHDVLLRDLEEFLRRRRQEGGEGKA